jgi:hypothetical protein
LCEEEERLRTGECGRVEDNINMEKSTIGQVDARTRYIYYPTL